MTKHSIIVPLSAAVLLAACNSAEPQADQVPGSIDETSTSAAAERSTAPATSEPATSATPTSGSADSPTIGGDGSPIRLGRLTSADIQAADVPGELGCAFTLTPTGQPSLIAAADVLDGEDARGRGVYKLGDYVEQVVTPYGGGFSAMADRGRFGAKGMTITITETGEPPARGGESPPYPATMTLQRGDGAERTVPGFWTCGP